MFYAATDTTMYWVHDEPLMRYLGVEATQPRFRATKFRRADAVAKLEEIASRPGANEKSRVSVLLANANQEQTLTITHVLWAMFGVLPPNQVQRPHRHQSVALDLILDAPESGCYSLLGTRLDEHGDIVDPTRVDWRAGCAFTTRRACGTPTTTRPASPRTSSRSRTRAADLPAQPRHQVHSAARSRRRLTRAMPRRARAGGYFAALVALVAILSAI